VIVTMAVSFGNFDLFIVHKVLVLEFPPLGGFVNLPRAA